MVNFQYLPEGVKILLKKEGRVLGKQLVKLIMQLLMLTLFPHKVWLITDLRAELVAACLRC